MNRDRKVDDERQPKHTTEVNEPLVDGRVIFRAGTDRNTTAPCESPSIQDSKIVAPYNREAQVRVEKCIQTAVRLVDEAVKLIASGKSPLFSQLEIYCADILSEIASDPGTVLGVWSSSNPSHKDHNQALSQRASKLSLLGSVMAHCLDLSSAECRNVAIAGLLHDLSLFHPFVEEQYSSNDGREVFLQHPNRSLDLLRGIPEVSPYTQIVITQVHEQVDGSGYPRGLYGHQTSLLSRILNLADAYISMLEPHMKRSSICPPDAIAYLVHQTTLGRFDKNCMEALLHANSIYPVGSQVILQDRKKARVLRSSGDSPTQPVIQLIDPPHTIVDLRRSETGIESPDDLPPDVQRLRISRFDEVLWKHPILG